MKTQLILTITAVALITGCKKESHVIVTSLVDRDLIPYFEIFEAEARARGISLNASYADIEARIADIDDGNVIGRCWYNSHNPNSILIDRDYWERASDLGREMVVFHELGHCYLERGHTEATNANGICLSIMASGTGSCRNLYREGTREYYLDELFAGK